MNWSHILQPGEATTETGADQLQADVMRFMAIIGFCLVAIFAVVQSLPLTPTEQEVVPGSQDVQQHKGAQEATQQLAKLQQRIVEASDELAILQQQQSRLQISLAKLAQQQQRADQHLNQTRELLWQQQQQQLESEPFIVKSDNRRPALPMAHVPEPSQQTEQNQQPQQNQQTPRQSAAPEGFVLRMASDEQLLTLLRQQRLSLFALDGQRGWRVTPRGEGFELMTGPVPGTYHEMTRDTVPVMLSQLVLSATEQVAPDSIIWGLVLPEEILARINELMARHAGGELVIGDNGRVDYRR